MTYKATKILHSIDPASKKEITSFELIYPRAFVHEEFLTHRALSRNAASSRATPIQTMIKSVEEDPAMPLQWGKNGKGMSDHGIMTPEEAAEAEKVWLEARDMAVQKARKMLRLTATPHKQTVNILLRPYEHIRVVATATEWDNFFWTRRHKDARPEFQHLANLMWAAKKEGEPTPLEPGQWHLPYIAKHEWDAVNMLSGASRDDAIGRLIKVSAARCARTSYKNHSNKVATFEEDLTLYNYLAAYNPENPLHASPLEHQATPDTFRVEFDTKTKKLHRVWSNIELHGNFIGFIQHRKTIPGECKTKYSPED